MSLRMLLFSGFFFICGEQRKKKDNKSKWYLRTTAQTHTHTPLEGVIYCHGMKYFLVAIISLYVTLTLYMKQGQDLLCSGTLDSLQFHFLETAPFFLFFGL